MPGIGDPGPSGIAAPNPAALVQPLQVQGGPDAVRVMIDAFRQGQISAQDIIDRVGERAQAKEKADIAQAKLQEASATAGLPLVEPNAEAVRRTALATAAKMRIEADNAALAGETQASKLKHENAVANLGIEGPKIEAMYLNAGKLIPMMESPRLPGAKIPDMNQILEDFPKLEAYTRYKQTQAQMDAAWTPVSKKTTAADGSEVTTQVWRNAFLPGVERNSRPFTKPVGYDNWLKSQEPGSVVTQQPVVEAAAPAPAPKALYTPVQIGPVAGTEAQPPSQEEAIKMQQQIERATGQNLGTAPLVQPAFPAAAPVVEPVNVIETKAPQDAVKRQYATQLGQAFKSNPLIMGMEQAQGAYTAATQTLNLIDKNGEYPKGTPEPKMLDYNLMVNYAKILDPNSVVREGEIALLKGTTSAWGRISDIKPTEPGAAKRFGDYVDAILGKQIYLGPERARLKSMLEGAYKDRINTALALKEVGAKALRKAGLSQEDIDANLPVVESGSSKPVAAPAAGASMAGPPIPLKNGRIVQRGADGRYYDVK